MRFNCGLPRRQRRSARHARLVEWHGWFAWWPVRVGDHDCRWLERVERSYRFSRATLNEFPLARPSDFLYRSAHP